MSLLVLLAHALKSQVVCWMSGERIVCSEATGGFLSDHPSTGKSFQYLEVLVRVCS